MNEKTAPILGCVDLLRPWLVGLPPVGDRSLDRARVVRSLAETLLARLEQPCAAVLDAAVRGQVVFGEDGAATATLVTTTGVGSGLPWVRQDGHYVATVVAGARQVLETVVDAAALVEAGRTAATWAVLDLAAEQLRRLFARTVVWEEGADFPHTAASTQALLDLQRASHDRGVPFAVPGQHSDWLGGTAQPTGSWDSALLAVPAAVGTLGAVRAGVALARSAITMDAVTRPDLTVEQRAAAETGEAQQDLQAVLALDLAALAASALCGFVTEHVDSRWASCEDEIRLAARIAAVHLLPEDER